MKHPLALQMIVCERGLGKLLPHTCARRWRIANDKEAGDVGVGRECITCPHGEGRSEGAVLPPRIVRTAQRHDAGDGRRLDCPCCGGDYVRVGRNQKYCKREACTKERGRLNAARQYEKKSGKPITAFPWESSTVATDSEPPPGLLDEMKGAAWPSRAKRVTPDVSTEAVVRRANRGA